MPVSEDLEIREGDQFVSKKPATGGYSWRVIEQPNPRARRIRCLCSDGTPTWIRRDELNLNFKRKPPPYGS